MDYPQGGYRWNGQWVHNPLSAGSGFQEPAGRQTTFAPEPQFQRSGGPGGYYPVPALMPGPVPANLLPAERQLYGQVFGPSKGGPPSVPVIGSARAARAARGVAAVSRFIRPPWVHMGEFAAEKYFDWLRNTTRPVAGGFYNFPGFDRRDSCGTRAEFYDMVRSYPCFQVQGAGAYYKNANDPATRVIQTWEWLSEAGQGPNGLQWGKAADTWIKRDDYAGSAVAVLPAMPWIDPLMMDWPALDPAMKPDVTRRPRSQAAPSQWPEADPVVRVGPDLMPWIDAVWMIDPWTGSSSATVPYPPLHDPPGPPNVAFAPAPLNMKEIKLQFHQWYKLALAAFNGASEARDFIEALWKALPDECRTKTPQMKVPQRKRREQRLGKQNPHTMIGDILRCAAPWGPFPGEPGGDIRPDRKGRYVRKPKMQAQRYWDRAAENLVMNQVQDYMFGKFGRKGKQASAASRPHGRIPIGLQMGSGSRGGV